MFTDFYSKSKSPKDYVNSAKASIGSLGSKLESRRKKFSEAKDEALNKIDVDAEKKVDN